MPWELGDVLSTTSSTRACVAWLRCNASQELGSHACSHAKIATLEASLYMRNHQLLRAPTGPAWRTTQVRVPLVDSVLLGRIAAMSSRAAADFGQRYQGASGAAKTLMPASVVSRAKTGFRHR
jgi:hypothetical protein